jgi:hypothetical protein
MAIIRTAKKYNFGDKNFLEITPIANNREIAINIIRRIRLFPEVFTSNTPMMLIIGRLTKTKANKEGKRGALILKLSFLLFK